MGWATHSAPVNLAFGTQKIVVTGPEEPTSGFVYGTSLENREVVNWDRGED